MQPYPENPQQQHQVVTMPPHQQQVHPGQQQVFIQPHPYQQGAVLVGQAAPVPKNRRYRVKAARTLGILQLIFATLSVIFGIIVAVASATGAWLGMAIWSAVFFYLPAGVFAIVSTKPMSMQTCLINTCMGMSIVSHLVSVGCIIYAIICATQEWYYDYSYGMHIVITSRVAYWSVIAFVSLGECIVSVVQAAYCCHASCTCCHGSTDTVRVQYANQVHYVVPQQHSAAQPQVAYQYPMQQQQQQQQLQQQMMTQQQQQQMVQQQQMQQQPIPSHGVQNVTLVQSAPPDEQNASGKGYDVESR